MVFCLVFVPDLSHMPHNALTTPDSKIFYGAVLNGLELKYFEMEILRIYDG